jgi:hypothetical protein
MSKKPKALGSGSGLAAAKPDSDRDACLWVGQFMRDWSFVEHAITKGLRELVGVEVLDGAILLANMQVRDKMSALKTLLNAYAPTEEDRVKFAALMNRAESMSTQRNIVAHNMFWIHESGGVEFSIKKAKGKLSFPKVVWSEKDFESRYSEMHAIFGELGRAVAAASLVRTSLGRSRKTTNLWSNTLFSTSSQPGEGLGALAALFGQAPPPQSVQRSPPPMPQTTAQTPKAPRQKPSGKNI